MARDDKEAPGSQMASSKSKEDEAAVDAAVERTRLDGELLKPLGIHRGERIRWDDVYRFVDAGEALPATERTA